MGARVTVAGASGYAGGELLRLLAGHPDLELGPVTADGNAGRLVTDVHPHLAGLRSLADRRFDPAGERVGSDCDLAFLALPAGQSARLARHIPDRVRVVDLGPDFRLADAAAWARHYEQAGAHPGHWTCGLPELPGGRERIRAADRVAVPGCYATAAILALAPLLAARLAEPGDIVITAASGTSGAGRAAKAELLASEVIGAASAYQAGGSHRHIPEIEQALAEAMAHSGDCCHGAVNHGAVNHGAVNHRAVGHRAVTVSFTPVLAPMSRGILATCTARLRPDAVAGSGGEPSWPGSAETGGDHAAPGPAASGGAGPASREVTERLRVDASAVSAGQAGTGRLRAVLAAACAGEPFVHLATAGRWPSTAAVAGSNAAHLQAAADPRTGRATVVAAIDNLGKGAAGQAVQVANLMLGLAETAGLTAAGIAP